MKNKKIILVSRLTSLVISKTVVIGETVEFIYCACGCQKTLAKYYLAGVYKGKTYYRKDRFPKYKSGHNMKKNKKYNDSNHRWKGDDVGYAALHFWVKRRLQKPELCQNCNKNKTRDLANITGLYNRDLLNWKYLCSLCHFYQDIEKHKRDPTNRKWMRLTS